MRESAGDDFGTSCDLNLQVPKALSKWFLRPLVMHASESESVADTVTVENVLTLARTTHFDAFAQNPTGLAL